MRNKGKYAVRRKYIVLLIVFMLIGVSLLIGKEVSDLYTERGTPVKEDSTNVIADWLDLFTQKDYRTCDTLIANDGYYITGFENTTESLFNPVSEGVYYKFFDLLIDAISSVEIKSSTYNEETGYTDYNIEIRYRPYKTISELSVNTNRVYKLLDKFKNEEISEDNFSSKIQEYCMDLFASSFEPEDTDVATPVYLVLSEKDGKVYGTKNFIQDLIPTEMRENLKVYERNLKSKINYVLEGYSY